MNRTAVLLLATATLVTACAQSTGTEKTRATSVRVIAATLGPAAPIIRTDGILANKDELRLSFKVGGMVSHIDVQEGQRVKRGQRLAEIELTEIDAQVEQARQLSEKSQRDVARAEKLYADRLISRGQFDDLHTEAAVAKAALQSAEFNRGYASIVAQRDGMILRRLIQERELVAAGTPVLVLGSEERGYVVRVGLADREIVQVRMGDAAEVELDAHPGETLPAQVVEIAGGADELTGLFQVELRLQPTALRLASGLVAKVALTPASALGTKKVYVPLAAIVEGDGHRASVFLLSGSSDHQVAKRRAIEVAFIDDAQVAIASGLNAGDQVVTDGALYLDDDEPIIVQDAGFAS